MQVWPCHTCTCQDAQNRLNALEVVEVRIEEQAKDLGVVLVVEGGGQLTQPPQELPVLYCTVLYCTVLYCTVLPIT